MSYIILLFSVCFARESLFKKEDPKTVESRDVNPVSTRRSSTSSAAAGARPFKTTTGNLDSEILVVNSKFNPDSSNEIIPKNPTIHKYKNVKPGDLIEAELREPILAFLDSKTPIRAVVRWGTLKGLILLGEASLEKNSKKVAINFDRVVSPEKEVFPIKGYALVEGDHHTNEERYFLAELLSAGTAGYVDATINRTQNSYGNYVEEPGVSSASKKALGAAAMKSAERFSERARSAPEYSLVRPSSSIQVILMD